MESLKYFLVILFLQLGFYQAYSTTWTITASGRSFAPTPVTANVGDTIKWQWVNGIHTTTSVSVPAGALIWNSPLDSLNPTFKYKVTTPGTYNYQCNFHAFFGMTGIINVNPIGIKPVGTTVPSVYDIQQNYPNPFNPSTNIKFDIPKSAPVKIVVYNILGDQAQILVDEVLQAGSYSVDWNASGFSSGIYFYKMESGVFSVTKRMILVK
jgi:plastocyanin